MRNPRSLDTAAKTPSSVEEAHRNVDAAMADERPAKQTVRNLWLEQAQHFDELYPQDDVPLYLTLSGAEARDIRLLAEHNLIKLTEVGGIAAESQDRIVAVERSLKCSFEITKAVAGFKDSPTRF